MKAQSFFFFFSVSCYGDFCQTRPQFSFEFILYSKSGNSKIKLFFCKASKKLWENFRLFYWAIEMNTNFVYISIADRYCLRDNKKTYIFRRI